MKKQRVLPIILILTMLITAVFPIGIAAMGSNPTKLDISAGSIVISDTGASGGGLAEAETELNPDGYVITGYTDTNSITVNPGVNTQIEIKDIYISLATTVSGTPTAMDIGEGADVKLSLSGNNTIMVTSSKASICTGIGLSGNANLSIDGRGNLTISGKSGAIGSKSGQPLSGMIEINGGSINATSPNGSAIGGRMGRGAGTIVINGGTILATAGGGNAAIGHGRAPGVAAQQGSTTIIVNGGSVNATLQNTPQNELGDELRLVTGTVEGKSNEVFTLTSADGGENEASSDGEGKLYMFIPKATTFVSVSKGRDMYYADGFAANTDVEVDLVLFSGGDCSCTTDNGSIKFDGGALVVNDTIGEESFALAAEFVPADGCEYPSHTLTDTEYRLAADVPNTYAKLSGSDLTVYAAAGGNDIKVTVTASVNGKEYSAAAVFSVVIDDSYAMDISDGNIVISADSITVGETVYPITDKNKTIRIYQSGNANNRTIRVEGTVKGREIELDNLDLEQTGRTSTDARISVLRGADVIFTLAGENRAVMYSTVNAPAINIASGAKAAFAGSGSLYAKGGDTYPAIGPNSRSMAMGDVTVWSGKLILVGGGETLNEAGNTNNDAAPAIGSPSMGQPGGTFTLKGGFVDAKGAPRSARGDIYTSVIIDGGSLVSPIEVNGTLRDSSGRDVYLTEFTIEDITGASDIIYYVTEGDASEGSLISTALDENGKLYLYMPADGKYRMIRALLTGDPDTYYFKRIKVDSTADKNTAVLIKNPAGAITAFNVAGRSGIIDESANPKTITVHVPASMDLKNSLPLVSCDGLEYRPSGAVNFQDNPEQTFSIILDNGKIVEYKVKIERTETGDDEPSVLDIRLGDINMDTDASGNAQITIGGQPVAENPNGYIITGTSSTNYIYIGSVNAPIIFNGLVLNAPPVIEEDNKLAPVMVGDESVKISIEGNNEITGGAGGSAMYIYGGASAVISGNGTLTLRGGSGARGVTSEDESAKLVIGDASVFIIDGEGAPEAGGTIPVNEADEPLYPLIVTIADEGAANQKLVYSDMRYDSSGEFVGSAANVEMLANSSAQLSVYKPAGSYMVNVHWNGDVYYSEENVTVSAENTPSNPAAVTLTIPGIKGLSFTAPKTSLATQVVVTLTGNNLGGDMSVIATGRDGETVTAKAQKTADGKWQALLNIPANKDETSLYRWTLSAKIGDEVQELEESLYFDMWARLAITSFSLGEGKQVGDAVIVDGVDVEDPMITVTVPYDIDLESALFYPAMTYTEGANVFASWGNGYDQWEGRSLKLDEQGRVDLEYLGKNDDVVSYSISAVNKETPVVNAISFTQPADYNGGDVVITLTGDNFENLANGSTDLAKQIVVSAGGAGSTSVRSSVTDENGNQVWRVTLHAPDNINGAQNAEYPITVTINGVEQTGIGRQVIVVPPRIEALANINDFTLNDADGNPFEAVSIDITHGTPGSVAGGTSGTPGKIAVVLPTGTDLAAASFIPNVTLENPDASLRIVDAEGTEYGIGEAIMFTETNMPVTLIIVSENGENTMSYELEVTVQPEKKKSSKKTTIEGVTPGSIRYNAYVNGYENGTFRPNNVITRAEAATILARLDKNFDEGISYSAYRQNFSDVAPAAWYAKYVAYLAKKGVITGYEDGSFHPADQITRMEFAALLSRFADATGMDLKDIEKELAGDSGSDSSSDSGVSGEVKHIVLNALTASASASDVLSIVPDAAGVIAAQGEENTVSIDSPAVPLSDVFGLWGEDYVIGLADAGVVSGYEDGTFRPASSTTRAETVKMLNRMLGRTLIPELEEVLADKANPFSDLADTHWAYDDIMMAVNDYTIRTTIIVHRVEVKVTLN